jgi:peptidoglycan/xylan/chitin deacetylase (PgdA/CDA1 family)
VVTCYITSDDNWEYEGLRWLLEILEAEDIRITFFVNKPEDRSLDELYKRAYDSGHEIGNHGSRHEVGIDLVSNIKSCGEYLQSIGIEGVQGFRMPFLSTKSVPDYYKKLSNAGMLYDSSEVSIPNPWVARKSMPPPLRGVRRVPLGHLRDYRQEVQNTDNVYIGLFDWDLFMRYSRPEDFLKVYLNTFKYSKDARIPFNLNVHSQFFNEKGWLGNSAVRSKDIRSSFRLFLNFLKKEDTEFLTLKQLVLRYWPLGSCT